MPGSLKIVQPSPEEVSDLVREAHEMRARVFADLVQRTVAWVSHQLHRGAHAH